MLYIIRPVLSSLSSPLAWKVCYRMSKHVKHRGSWIKQFYSICSALALALSCLQLLIYVGLGSQPVRLQAILNSCTLGFQDVMKCSGPFGELGRWQYNYTG